MAIKISGSTIIDDSRNIVNAGVITATSFSGDGSGLTGVTAVGSGVAVQDDGSLVGTATTINFGSNITATISSGVATIDATGGGSVGTAGTWSVTSVGIHTTKNVGIGTTNPTSALTVAGDGRFSGVVTATRFESSSAGTPTIDSPNNLNINAVTVAISTDATIGSRLIVSGISTLNSGGINVAGVVTAFKFIGDGSQLTGVAASFTGAASTITSGQISNWNTAYSWGNHAVVGYATTGYVNSAVAGLSTFSGSYNDLTNKPSIPVNINDLSDVNAGAPTTGHVLKWSGTEWQASPDLTASGAGIGLSDLSVTINPAGINSLTYNNATGVFLFTPTNLSGYLTTETSHADVVVDGDFTSSGLMRRGAAPGTYSIVADNSSNWNTAYGWGDHAVVGYLTTSNLVGYLTTGNLVGYATEGYVNNAVVGFITAGSISGFVTAGYVGLQTFVGAATTITTLQISNWDTAYSWGNHSAVGYVTAGYVSNASVAFATLAGLATYATSSGVSTDVVGGQASVAQLNVSGISTLGVTTTTHLTAQQVNVSGVVTATRFESSSAGTPTIDSPNNLNINAVTVAISTDVTIGGDITSVGDITSSGSITSQLFIVSGDSSISISTNTISGPSELIIDPDGIGDNTGTVIIKGDLQVDGTQTTINSTSLTVDDKNITLASGSPNSAAADGAGITIDGANATLNYVSTGDKWVFNKVPYYNLARILTTDDEGSGNSLDADTVDGFQASQFLRSDANINITDYSVGIGTTAWPVTSLGGTADFYVTNRTLWEGGSGIWTGRNYYVGVASDGITFHAPSNNNSATDFAGKEFRIYTNSEGKQRFTIGNAPAWVATVISLPSPDPSDPELASYLSVANWEINGNETFQVGNSNSSNGNDGFAKITKTLQIGTSFYPYSKGVFIDADRRTVAVGAAITMNGRTGIVTAVGFHGNVNAGLSTLGIATATNLTTQQLSVSGVSTFRDVVSLRDSSSTYIINARYDQIVGYQVGAGYWQDRYLSLSTNSNYIIPNVGIGTTNATSKLTVSGDVSISGVSTFTNTINLNAGNLKVATDGIIKVGSSDQLEIYYSGSIGQTIKSTSDLRILTTRLLLNNAANDEQIIEATQNGSVALFHDNSKKFETIGAGVTVTGTTFTNQLVSSGVVTATSFSGSNTLKSRTIVSGATTSIDNNGIGNTNITGYKSYSLMKVGLSTAGWLRLYTDSASRSADASRSIGIDPAPGAGVIAEVVTTGISTTQIMTPFVMGGNLDEPVSTTIYAAVTNLSGVTTSISVNLTILQLEV